MITNSSITSIQEVLVDGLNFATALSVMSFPRNSLGGFRKISVQIKWANLTGTLNGSVKLQQNNYPGYTFTDISSLSQSLDSASGSVIFDASEFIGENLNLVITKGSITGGTISAVLVAKR